MGFLVEQLRARGVDARGIDISDYAIAQAHASIKSYVRVGSIAEPFDARYDLITCIEVLEHMPKADAERAIANFCTHTDDVLFSSSSDDYAEASHINVQPSEVWAELFARHGFYRDVDFDASFITPWAVRYRKSSEPLARVARNYERGYARLARENADLRKALNQTREQLNAASAIQQDTNDGALRHQLDAARATIRAYENGKFMRLMRWINSFAQNKRR